MKSQLFQILMNLSRWFLSNQRILPWRTDPSVYRVWISEIMLQQTQVKTVVPYFEKFIARFPDVKTLALASLDEVLLYWAGLGYYSRARNIHKTARLIEERGEFPNSRKEWLNLPGIGAYSAGAILSIALNLPEAILDGNVERILCRVRAIKNPKENKKRLWRLSEKLVHLAWKYQIKPSVFNQAMIELGATVCSPKNPDCKNCPFSLVCRAKLMGKPAEYPAPRKKSWKKVLEKVYCITDRNNNVLIEKREGIGWRKGLYDFPDQIPGFIEQFLLSLRKEIQTSHVVTQHKITRITQILNYDGLLEENEQGKFHRLNLFSERIPVAIGSALKKTLLQIRRDFDR